MSTRPDTILATLIANRVETMPDRDVLTIEGAGVRNDEVRTYRQLWDNGQRLAQVLIDRGLRPGEHFALLMANHAEFIDAMVAASIAGIVFVPIDPRTKGDKLAYMLDNAQCRGVIAADYALDNLCRRAGCARAPVVGDRARNRRGREADLRLSRRAVVPRVTGREQVPRVAHSDSDPESPMQLIFTSGTTGDPKGIVMTHRRYCETSAAVPAMFGYAADDRPYSGLSLTHANAQVITLGASLATGMRAVLSRRFTKSRLWDITRRYRCTTFTLLGGMTTAVYSEPAKAGRRRQPGALRDFRGDAGGDLDRLRAPLQRADRRVLRRGRGRARRSSRRGRARRQYRQAGADAQASHRRRGRPRLRTGRPGELLFRPADGSPFKVEYFGNPEASARKCHDGWLHMGDVVHEDEDGWLFFEYRKGGGIRRNGEFINPASIEKAIAESGGRRRVRLRRPGVIRRAWREGRGRGRGAETGGGLRSAAGVPPLPRAARGELGDFVPAGRARDSQDCIGKTTGAPSRRNVRAAARQRFHRDSMTVPARESNTAHA